MKNSKKIYITPDKEIIAEQSFAGNRAWSIFMLAFIRLFYVSIFERALYNYLYFEIDISESMLGLIASVGAIAYIFAPIIGSVITKRIGNRNAIIFASMITPILTGIQMLYFEPWFLIGCRILLGFSIGLFWPNCFSLLSKWQSKNTVEKSNRDFRNFNFSWNLGFISGLLIGFVWAFSFNDYFAMVISWSLTFLLIPFSFFIKKDSEDPNSNENIQNQTDRENSNNNIKNNSHSNSNTPLLIYPILFSWMCLTVWTISKSIFIYGYPVFLKSFEMPSYLTYLVQCGMQFTQVLGLTLINLMSIYKRKITALISTIGIIFISYTVVAFGNLLYISIIFAFSGLFFGLIQGLAMKIMVEYGAAENTSNYSTINEVIVGMCFGITPLIAGYVFEVNIYATFVFIVVFGFFALALLIYFSRNVKREK